MRIERKRLWSLVCSILFLAMFMAVSGCSKEAKIERHW
jgi:hypothetical protein